MSDPICGKPAGRSGVVRHRQGWKARLNAWRKHTALNPYWLTWRTLDRSIAELAPHAKGVLLDVGVAERPHEAMFAPYVERYLGLDYPPVLEDKEPALWEMLSTVRNTVDVFGDGHYLPFQEASVDTVLATEVLEHVTEPRRCLAELARVLRPGGVLLLTVPLCEPLHFLPQDFWRFTPEGLRRLVEEQGLVLVEIKPRGSFPEALASLTAQWLLRALAARRIQADGSVVPSPWRQALLMPVFALVQWLGTALSRLRGGDGLVLGYGVVARKP